MTASKAILIAGPTASGKSALALDYAQTLDGTVINADSMQVYAELRVLTARPSAADEAKAPHALYGHVHGADGYSAGRYCVDAAGAIAEARGAGRTPIIVGGTGLYFKALLEGLAPVPDVPGDVRAHWRAEASRLGPAGLHEILVARDATMALKLPPTDPQRLIRALEVLEATGKSLSYWQSQPGVPVLKPAETRRLVLMPDREALYRRCDARLDAMMEDDAMVADGAMMADDAGNGGALGEVGDLMALGLDPALPVMRALGVRPLSALLAGSIGRQEAVERAKTDTRQFAKRQLTWLRKHMITWEALNEQ